MKFKKIALLLLTLLVVGCSGNTTSSSSESFSAPSSSEVSSTTSSEITSSTTSSVNPSSSSTSSGSQEPIDYVHNGSTVLDVDYKGKDFFKDGIGAVTLATKIDGDTAHFYPVNTSTSREKIKSRFYGIDTPESTGKIQPYGHGASVFTGSKLDNAAKNGTIVISTPGLGYKVPQKDSTGSRYLSLVWINETKKDANFDELVLLNLWIVQDGWSVVNQLDKAPYLQSVFIAAEAQAKTLKLNMHSGKPDPDFNYGDYKTVSILDMKKELVKSLEDPTHVNKFNNEKVRITGTVAGYINKTLYLQGFFTQEEGASKPQGEYAAMNIYTGTGVIPDRYTQLNAVVMLCGTAVVSETFGFQISGVNFPQLPSRESDKTARVMLTPEDNVDETTKLHVFEYTVAELNHLVETKDYSCLYCAVKITDTFKVTDVYENESGDEWTLYINNQSQYSTKAFNIYINFPYKPDPDGPIWKKEDFLNKYYTVEGVYGIHTFSSGRVSYQITPRDSSNLVCTSL